MEANISQRCLPVKGVAAMVGLSKSTIYAMLKDARLNFPRPFKIGRGTFFVQAEIEQWLASRPRLTGSLSVK